MIQIRNVIRTGELFCMGHPSWVGKDRLADDGLILSVNEQNGQPSRTNLPSETPPGDRHGRDSFLPHFEEQNGGGAGGGRVSHRSSTPLAATSAQSTLILTAPKTIVRRLRSAHTGLDHPHPGLPPKSEGRILGEGSEETPPGDRHGRDSSLSHSCESCGWEIGGKIFEEVSMRNIHLAEQKKSLRFTPLMRI
jgi:hypothetical protein